MTLSREQLVSLCHLLSHILKRVITITDWSKCSRYDLRGAPTARNLWQHISGETARTMQTGRRHYDCARWTNNVYPKLSCDTIRTYSQLAKATSRLRNFKLINTRLLVVVWASKQSIIISTILWKRKRKQQHSKSHRSLLTLKNKGHRTDSTRESRENALPNYPVLCSSCCSGTCRRWRPVMLGLYGMHRIHTSEAHNY